MKELGIALFALLFGYFIAGKTKIKWSVDPEAQQLLAVGVMFFLLLAGFGVFAYLLK